MASRPQPVRYAGQYQPVQAGPAYVHPNSQAVSSRRISLFIFVALSLFFTSGTEDLLANAVTNLTIPANAVTNLTIPASFLGYGWTVGATCLCASSFLCKKTLPEA